MQRKAWFVVLVSLLIGLCANKGFAESPTQPSTLVATRFSTNEIAFTTGYGYSLRRKAFEEHNFSIYPFAVRYGWNLNRPLGLSGASSALYATVEPFVNMIVGKEQGREVGCGVGVRYRRAVSQHANFFAEGSVAPMELTINTPEQGAAGFNFLDQFGVGLQHEVGQRTHLFVGYRFRHISHAGLIDRSNGGINSHGVMIGISLIQ
uniref:Acyloxyacyl hydrolase n=1 Tax=Chlorobium chlorochromatii (strain CaD3) TaxID=340177 RepID=Q3AP90_CHLCH